VPPDLTLVQINWVGDPTMQDDLGVSPKLSLCAIQARASTKLILAFHLNFAQIRIVTGVDEM
jgi:hypothetical protein